MISGNIQKTQVRFPNTMYFSQDFHVSLSASPGSQRKIP
ncbi:hypothetical protein MPLDJ20_230102 [Mesorhizobium plurifarium]|uniref:Uncharacterized protein n=1 Tax=Mesorhizobium plurifarium TaxID=69974 RepID=A0A090GM88_MESPL|nr:hypothetical protein MPLDJ20_230102 [Mesorhizobium plurifarium]